MLAAATLSTSLVSSATAQGTEGHRFSDEERGFWFWQPIGHPAVPAGAEDASHPIDAFLLARLRTAGITAAAEADRRTLIRRATYDLHGLPPTTDEVDAFIADTSPDAYERLIDRLLASPRYGEHQARQWLDLVRYAESDGFKSDDLRPNAWRYRDYVIDAFNADMPFDQFATEQLAGDELAPEEPRAMVATGYLRLGPYEENGRDVADQRCNILNDITDVTGQVFLGLTIGCARCHDHKYDPILQADYFRLQAFFAGLTCGDEEPLGRPEERAAYAARLATWEAATVEARQQIADLEKPHREKVIAEKRAFFPDYVKDILGMPAERRSVLQVQMVSLASRQLSANADELAKRMSAEDRSRYTALRKEVQECEGGPPPALPRGLVAHDIGPQAPPTTIPGEDDVIEPGYLSIIDAEPARIPSPGSSSTGRRLALARWITNPENPLTPRVTVNRIWQQHFARGLVASSGDFGRQGERPTHPELLDYLASEWIADGFKLKPLHRLIMTSAAYRRGSDVSAEAAGADPDNALLSRYPRRRLSAEQLRDALLASSHELNLEAGGPSVHSELPKGISPAYAWKPDRDPAQRNRRSVYLLVRRNLREPLLEVFDMPDTHESCTRRLETTTAPQALFLFNSSWALDRARAMASHVAAVAVDSAQTVREAYRIAYQRLPNEEELAAGQQFLTAERADAPNISADEARTVALLDFCHVLLNSNEYMYLD